MVLLVGMGLVGGPRDLWAWKNLIIVVAFNNTSSRVSIVQVFVVFVFFSEFFHIYIHSFHFHTVPLT